MTNEEVRISIGMDVVFPLSQHFGAHFASCHTLSKAFLEICFVVLLPDLLQFSLQLVVRDGLS